MSEVGKRLSIIIPTFTVSEDLLAMALVCANSFRPFVDEMIICEDTNSYIKELHDISDIYITHPNYQLAANANLGWKASSGDYISQASADTVLLEGDPHVLCLPDVFSMPQVLRRNVTETCCYFVLSRAMYVSHSPYGLWDEDLKWAGTDTALFNKFPDRAMDHSVIIDTENASPGSSVRARGFAEIWTGKSLMEQRNATT